MHKHLRYIALTLGTIAAIMVLVMLPTDGAEATSITRNAVTFGAANDNYSTPYETQLVVSAPGVLANDFGPNAVVAASGTTTQGGTFNVVTDGSFTYDPPSGFVGDDTFDYEATDGFTTDTATVTINIPNDPPVAVDDNYTALVDTQLNVPAPGVLSNDTDPQGTTLNAVAASGTTTQGGDITVNADGSFTYDPPATYEGADDFVYTVTDGTDSASGTVNLSVIVFDAVDDSYSTPYETQLVVAAPGVLTNDVAATAVTADSGSTTEGGTYSIAADGSFTYDPPTGFFDGDDSFTYTATDGGMASDTATVTINVPNDAPVAADDTYSAFMDTQLVIAAPGVLSNDTDAQGTSLTATPIAAGATAQSGTVTLNADGSFTYDPPASFTGTDTFTYDISDGLASDSATVTLNVAMPVGTPGRIYPADMQMLTSGNASDWSQFTFQAAPGIEWYSVWVGPQDYSYEALFVWYEASQICSAGVCTVPADVWLSDGDYYWWMTYWGPDDQDFNTYWNETTFNVDFEAPTDAFTLTNPAAGSTVSAAPTTIEWARDTNVLWYQIWVGPNTYATSQFFAWVDATEICDAMTCSIDVSDQTFADGGYEVWAEQWGPGGYATWPAVPSGTFTIDTAAPAPMIEPVRE